MQWKRRFIRLAMKLKIIRFFWRSLAVCNLYSITTNQAAIIALFRVVNRYVGNLAPMPGVFPDYPAPVVRNTDTGRELSNGMDAPPI